MLSEKNIVIIGGTTGLGLSAALAFTRQGARVVVTGRNTESCEHANEQLSGQGLVVNCDATIEGSTESAIEAGLNKWGPLHGLYHVAGGSGRKVGDGPIHEMSLSGWNTTLELNLTSVMLSNRAAIRTFLRQGNGGTILNMGSVLGFSPSPKFFTTHAYAAAKSAIIGFSKSIASYYAKDNIRANVIAPALVETPMAQRAAGDTDIQEFIHTKQPLDGGRIGTPQDLDGACSLDGGWSISEGQIPKDE
jgi:NAD(P)-dependent dehydrogenase (short-subunit alcohol dehydrogenase family)